MTLPLQPGEPLIDYNDRRAGELAVELATLLDLLPEYGSVHPPTTRTGMRRRKKLLVLRDELNIYLGQAGNEE